MPRYTVDISDKVVKDLELFAKRNGISRAEAARRAFALLALADAEANKGNTLGIVHENEESHELEVVARVVGV
ncbi:hypothetical protein JZN57_002769 [Vibrio alginolyticus]|nr:hypothetical protein [Vibrio alginolyticus]